MAKKTLEVGTKVFSKRFKSTGTIVEIKSGGKDFNVRSDRGGNFNTDRADLSVIKKD